MIETNQGSGEPAEGWVEVGNSSGVWVLTLHGEHDVSTQPMLREQLAHVVGAGGPVVVDLSKAAAVDSTVLATVVAFHRDDGVGVSEVAIVAPDHYGGTRLVELVGVGTSIALYESREAAIAAFGGRIA